MCQATHTAPRSQLPLSLSYLHDLIGKQACAGQAADCLRNLRGWQMCLFSEQCGLYCIQLPGAAGDPAGQVRQCLCNISCKWRSTRSSPYRTAEHRGPCRSPAGSDEKPATYARTQLSSVQRLENGPRFLHPRNVAAFRYPELDWLQPNLRAAEAGAAGVWSSGCCRRSVNAGE
jgi:hypothetical protein